ncbi:MAG: hypothetical protein R2789_13445 [Microthrixaceae bacterium]
MRSTPLGGPRCVILVAVGTSLAASKWGGETTNDFSIPGLDSQDALDVLSSDFPQLAGTSAQVVFETTGETVDEFEDAIQQTIANLGIDRRGRIGQQPAGRQHTTPQLAEFPERHHRLRDRAVSCGGEGPPSRTPSTRSSGLPRTPSTPA